MTTYADRELSRADSQPVECFKFTRVRGDITDVWLYTNDQVPRRFKDELYAACAGIHRGAIEQHAEDRSMQIELTIPRTLCLADELKGRVSPAPILVTVWRLQRGLSDDEAKPIYHGECSNPVYEGSLVTITCLSEESAWSQTLGRVFAQRTCPHMLFDDFCGAVRKRVTFTGKITALSDDLMTMTVTESSPVDHLASDSHYYVAGFVNAGGRYVFVTGQAGAALTLQTPAVDAIVGDTIQLTAGCDRSQADCLNVHDNIDRFGGFPLMPTRSPWTRVI